MARNSTPIAQPASLSAEQMRAAFPKLDRRIKDLETFDIQSVRKRFDPLLEVLAAKVNGTLQEILGHATVEYQQYRVKDNFDTLPIVVGRQNLLPEVQQGCREGIEHAILKLKTLKGLFEERIADAASEARITKVSAPAPTNTVRSTPNPRSVFVVHGHNSGIKETVARFLTKLELYPIILHEKPNEGKTVVEKFEAHSDVAYAVILFTPDDVGYPADSPEAAKPRARQNVVLELGFFLGTLGRRKVCVLYTDGVEIPSDYDGVLYVSLDDSDAWRLKLAKEIKSAGIDIDMNRAIE